ncbi:MAG: penicillin-insensitive murein endopeptidase [Deltaproteobacteria bacterium]|nr:penicillin-insensitive murein endopeptidase [Deltaproteobacteria bacterium]
MRAPWAFSVVLLAGSGCAPNVPPGRSVSVGTSSHGYLRSGVRMPLAGPGFKVVRDPEAAFGTARMVGLITRAAAAVERRLGPGPDLRVGDLSLEAGGRIEGHGSHRAGRDADVLYFARDAAGRPADPGAMAFRRTGEGERDGRRYRLDTTRTWALVEAMLTDSEVEVQWIFCSHGIKVLLIEEALAQGEGADLELVRRAAWILHRPSNSRPHDDHLHVRIFCSEEERALGCADTAPLWAWSSADEKLPASSATDEEILAALGSEPEGTGRVAAH